MAENTQHDTPEGLARAQFQQLFGLMSGYRVSQAVYVAARLGIADLLKDGPRESDDVAQATETHADALTRVLRFLAGVGLFEEVAPRRFALTPLGAGLRADVPRSLRPMALMLLDEAHWPAWGQMLHSVRTGETAFSHVHGMGLFDYLGQHPDAAAVFHQAMTSSTARSGTTLPEVYDFSEIGRLVDVGGGHGLLLATLLRAYPTLRGVLFDRPEVVAGAAAVLEQAGVANRCEIVGGDFFASVPAGGDAYLLRQIIHDWGDAQASTILANCRRALGAQGRVLVIERGIASDPRAALPILHLDMEMLVNVGGSQRTDAGYRALFATSGFELTRIVPLGDVEQFSIFEGRSV
ncbi:MAG: methyltransferase [Chloroflexota bacterium]